MGLKDKFDLSGFQLVPNGKIPLRCHQRFQHDILWSYGKCEELLQRKQTGLGRERCQ